MVCCNPYHLRVLQPSNLQYPKQPSFCSLLTCFLLFCHGSWEVQAAKRWNHLGMTTLCSCSQCSWCRCLTSAAIVASKPWLANTQWYLALGQAYKIYKCSIIAIIYIYIYIRYFDSTYSMCKIAKLILKSSSELKNDCNFIVLLDNLRRPNRIWSIIPVCRSDPSNTPLPSHALWRLPAARVFPESTWQRDSFCLSMPGQADSSGLLWWHLKIHLQLELLQEDCRNFINCWRAQILFRMLCALRTATWPCSAAKCAADKPNKRSVLSAANWLTFQATNLGLNAA